MKVIAKTENKDIATVYIAEASEASLFGENKLVEFVESVQPPIPREKKWVLIISTLFGCPVKCKFCDSGGFYNGKLTKEDMFDQIDYLITSRYPDRIIPVEKFKIQFARMGEPAFNNEALSVLEDFPSRYDAPGFMPSISTIAPKGCDDFMSKLIDIKNKLYKGRFQMQFSIHSTNAAQRDELMPVKKWSFAEIAEFGDNFFMRNDRKITLNFALAKDSELDPKVLKEYFSPDIFFIKLTPVNPTYKANENKIASLISIENERRELIKSIEAEGYEVLLSIGELEENNIGSNCGQHIMAYMKENKAMKDAYTYEIQSCETIHPDFLYRD